MLESHNRFEDFLNYQGQMFHHLHSIIYEMQLGGLHASYHHHSSQHFQQPHHQQRQQYPTSASPPFFGIRAPVYYPPAPAPSPNQIVPSHPTQLQSPESPSSDSIDYEVDDSASTVSNTSIVNAVLNNNSEPSTSRFHSIINLIDTDDDQEPGPSHRHRQAEQRQPLAEAAQQQSVVVPVPVYHHQPEAGTLQQQPVARPASSDVCIICQFPPRHKVSIRPCNHEFCRTCIRKWVFMKVRRDDTGNLDLSRLQDCPICRKKLSRNYAMTRLY